MAEVEIAQSLPKSLLSGSGGTPKGVQVGELLHGEVAEQGLRRRIANPV
jgi:hypothetical protein